MPLEPDLVPLKNDPGKAVMAQDSKAVPERERDSRAAEVLKFLGFEVAPIEVVFGVRESSAFTGLMKRHILRMMKYNLKHLEVS